MICEFQSLALKNSDISLIYFFSFLSRAISPALTGTIYAASLSEWTMFIGFPVDYNLMFVIFGGILLIMVLLTACLPTSVNHQKTWSYLKLNIYLWTSMYVYKAEIMKYSSRSQQKGIIIIIS